MNARPHPLLPILGMLLAASVQAQPAVLPQAHAHNDYEHPRPLLDALDRGFGSVEADVHLVDGRLLVAHDREDVQPDRTLEALYLDPLRERVRRHEGRVYPEGPPLLLLIDIKSDAEATYAVLRRTLRRYADMLTIFAGDAAEEGAVTAVLSGNRPRAWMETEPVRFAAYDGRLDDLEADPPAPAGFMPLVSSNWAEIARWHGEGPLPEEAHRRLRAVVGRAHDQGRRIRFWATADNPAVWQALYEAGVDLLGTDDLEALQAFLLDRQMP